MTNDHPDDELDDEPDPRQLADAIRRRSNPLFYSSETPGFDKPDTYGRLQPTHVEDEPEPTGREIAAKIRRPGNPFPPNRDYLPPRSI